jgi:hypothetical protein
MLFTPLLRYSKKLMKNSLKSKLICTSKSSRKSKSSSNSRKLKLNRLRNRLPKLRQEMSISNPSLRPHMLQFHAIKDQRRAIKSTSIVMKIQMTMMSHPMIRAEEVLEPLTESLKNPPIVIMRGHMVEEALVKSLIGNVLLRMRVTLVRLKMTMRILSQTARKMRKSGTTTASFAISQMAI